MASKWIGILVLGLTMTLAATAFAGEKTLQKELARINVVTGSDPLENTVNALLKDKQDTKKLLQIGLPAAKKKDLSYNGALALGFVAAKMKDMKTAETYLRVCMDKGAKLQSVTDLLRPYDILVKNYYQNKQYKDAARICKELLELNTDDGKERVVVGEGREPTDRFDTAQRLRPYITEFYIKAVAKQGKFDQAIKLVDNMIKRRNDWRDQHLKGWVLNEAGKLAAAADEYETTIKQVKKDPTLDEKEKEEYIEQFRYEVSNVYIELKKIDRATAHLEYLVKKQPNDPMYCNDLGYVWADNGMKLEEAEKLIRKALELDRERRKKNKNYDPKTDHDNGAYLDSLGWVLFKQKKNAEAKEQLLKAVADKNAQSIEIFDHLGDVCQALGERAAAEKAWRQGLEVATDSRRDQERKVIVEKKLDNAKEAK